MAENKRVMISSTARDLPDHRQAAMDGCLRQGMFPFMMEHLPATDADAKQVSLELVDSADIYLGIFAHRYGYVPEGSDISITEMEYNRAVERKIPRLLFLMHADHHLKAEDVETGGHAEKLKAFKERIAKERVVNYFKSPEGLRADIINSLSAHREPDLTAFHYVSDIPKLPEPYIAHAYTLMQTRDLIGRNKELNLLTDWVSKPAADVYKARILNIVAIGGMGKSALTWKWFNDVVARKMNPLHGCMWWSFYESGATFENLIIRALAYVTGHAVEEVEKLPSPVREATLLNVLNNSSFMLVLDGLERLLVAYASMDAARMSDDELERKARMISGTAARSSRQAASRPFVSQHHLLKTADPRVGAFLRKLASLKASRVLTTTRLYPSDLMTNTGEPIFGSYNYPLKGLSNDDALDLWRSADVTGSRVPLLEMFKAFDNHPLLIQALASEVANYRWAPRRFDRWRRDHPGFDPLELPPEQVKSEVLAFALQGLEGDARAVLQVIAAFRMPAAYDTLAELLVGNRKKFDDETSLITVLTELEARGLLGWDKQANRYDLHPIVRSEVWHNLEDGAKKDIYRMLLKHFKKIELPDINKVERFEDLTPTVEYFNTLIGLRHYKQAAELFDKHLDQETLYRLSANLQRAELLKLFFPDGTDKPPRLRNPDDQAFILSSLASAYLAWQPESAASLITRQNEIHESLEQWKNLCAGLGHLSNALRQAGRLHDSDAAARRALDIARQLKKPRDRQFMGAVSMGWLGICLAVIGAADAEKTLRDTLQTFERRRQESSRLSKTTHGSSFESATYAFMARLMLWKGKNKAARRYAECAEREAKVERYERHMILVQRLKGAVALALDEREEANEYLQAALLNARSAFLVNEEAQALTELAELRCRGGNYKEARYLLDEFWELTEDSSYPLIKANAFNLLAQIERNENRAQKAAEAALRAYQLAWCDGLPFAYHWGLKRAAAHLKALGVPRPVMPVGQFIKNETDGNNVPPVIPPEPQTRKSNRKIHRAF